VQSYYRRFLRRQAQPSEAGGWANLLMQGVRDEAVIADMMGSDEYFADSQGT
jgi:hypothetical protein